MTVLHPLFHWAPADRRAAIRRRGLRPRSKPTCSGQRWPYVCLSQSPSQAWSLSAMVHGERGQDWDCWQVTLDVADAVEVRPFYGNRIEELRVQGPIPASRVWLIGTRAVPETGRRW